MPRLSKVRQASIRATGPLKVRDVVADVQALHTVPVHAGAVFQVASQFNMLEMVSPRVSPEQGVGTYEHDQTQGPACAIACGAGTVFRNYFVDADGGRAFGNRADWIVDTVLHGLACVANNGLDVRIVSYGGSSAVAQDILTRWHA
ncbi:hypothetical protein [Ascidiaceihabitans sp.]|uniref:hypothetical protein n=1 Tax=Ascidiaceihabitans sp. TaxID=1872644 RepID=UPI0032974AA4